MNKKKSGWSIAAALATAALAASFQTSAQAYNANLAYDGGAVVSFEGRTYRAKWYANAGQSPADVHTFTHPWETLWELVDDQAGPDDNASPPHLNQEQFAKDDIIKARIKRIQRLTKDGVKADYEVLKVLEHRSASPKVQLRMNFGGSDERAP